VCVCVSFAQHTQIHRVAQILTHTVTSWPRAVLDCYGHSDCECLLVNASQPSSQPTDCRSALSPCEIVSIAVATGRCHHPPPTTHTPSPHFSHPPNTPNTHTNTHTLSTMSTTCAGCANFRKKGAG